MLLFSILKNNPFVQYMYFEDRQGIYGEAIKIIIDI